MPVQVQQSSLAAKMGGRLSSTNAECAGKPLDLGRQRLPGGIRDGVAKLQTMVWKVQEKDDGKVPKGEIYFSGSAVALLPIDHVGVKVVGQQTFFQIPLCDVPAKGMRKATDFKSNFNKFRSLLEALGIGPCPESNQTDPTGVKTEAYWKAAMQSLCSPQRAQGPVYISFSTRDWTPPKTPAQPNPDTMTIEDWHGPADPAKVAQLNGQTNPGAGVVDNTSSSTQPEPFEEPPMGVVDPRSLPPDRFAGATIDDEVSVLVETAMSDPEGATEEGAQASARLEELAWATGWTREQTAGATDWAQVGDMALNPPTANPSQTTCADPTEHVVVSGSRWLFAKRGKDGAKFKNNKGEELPSQEVEVVAVDPASKTCTVKNAKDGKDVVDIRTKKPVAVKFEWLEVAN